MRPQVVMGKEKAASDSSLEVEGRESPKEDIDPNSAKIAFLRARVTSLDSPFNQGELCLNLARYLAEPGEHEFSTYHNQPMSSANYPNSKKSNHRMNGDIYQYNAPTKGDPGLYFLKTDSNSSEIYREYYSTRALNIFSMVRPLVTAPKVYLTRVRDGEGPKAVYKPHLLSEFVASNAGEKTEFEGIPMFPYLAAIMLCRKDRDVNPANYLLATESVVTKQRVEHHIPIAVRIDHGSSYEDVTRNPLANKGLVKQPIEALFALTSVFENNLDLMYSDVKWQAYHSYGKINFKDSLKRDEQGMLMIKDELNYMLFMRGICDFVETPPELLHMCFPQSSRKMSQCLKNDFIQTQGEVSEFFAREIERFHTMSRQEPWVSLGSEYMDSIPFHRIIANYQQICEDCGYPDQIILNNVQAQERAKKAAAAAVVENVDQVVAIPTTVFAITGTTSLESGREVTGDIHSDSAVDRLKARESTEKESGGRGDEY